jgi:hypothetical protein
MVDFLANLLQNVGWNRINHILGIDGQHPDNTLGPSWIINNPTAASLAATGRSPPQFPDPA